MLCSYESDERERERERKRERDGVNFTEHAGERGPFICNLMRSKLFLMEPYCMYQIPS